MRIGGIHLGLVLLALAASASAHAEPAFHGDAFRYPNRAFLPRLASDYAAIPAAVPHWDAVDWTWFGTTAATVVALMLPLEPSLDVRLQRRINGALPDDRFRLWSPENDLFIFGGLAAATAGALGYGLWRDDGAFVELFSLITEAVVVTQSFHVVSKVLIGREDPKHDGSEGRVLGPVAGLRLFPSGTPSGHAATVFAMVSLVTRYFPDQKVLSYALHLAAYAMATFLVVDDYHYLSDVVWGASMGYAIGRWVAHQRSSRYGEPEQPLAWQLTPTWTTDGRAMGVGLSLRW